MAGGAGEGLGEAVELGQGCEAGPDRGGGRELDEGGCIEAGGEAGEVEARGDEGGEELGLARGEGLGGRAGHWDGMYEPVEQKQAASGACREMCARRR